LLFLQRIDLHAILQSGGEADRADAIFQLASYVLRID